MQTCSEKCRSNVGQTARTYRELRMNVVFKNFSNVHLKHHSILYVHSMAGQWTDCRRTMDVTRTYCVHGWFSNGRLASQPGLKSPASVRYIHVRSHRILVIFQELQGHRVNAMLDTCRTLRQGLYAGQCALVTTLIWNFTLRAIISCLSNSAVSKMYNIHSITIILL